MTVPSDELRRSFDPTTFSQQADVLNAVLDSVSQGIVVVGADYRVLAFNRNFEELFQLPPGTVDVGVDFRDMLKVWADVTGQNPQLLDSAILQLDSATPFECEFSQQIKGEPRWCLLTHNPLPGKGFVRTYTNITERRQAEEAMKQAEWKFQALFEHGPIGVAYHRMVYDEAGQPTDYFFLDANEKYIELTGVDPRGKNVTEAFPGIEKDSFDWIGTYGRVARTGEAIRFEQYLEANDRWYDCVGYQYKPDHFVAAFLEVTQRKQAEEALAEREERYRTFFMHGPDGIVVLDPGTSRPLEFNDQACHQLGYTREEFARLTLADIEAKETIQETVDCIQDVMVKGVVDFETMQRTKQGALRNIHVTAKYIQTNGGSTYHCVWRDTTERKRAEEALRKSEKDYRTLIDNLSSGIVVHGADTAVLISNRMASSLLGLTEEQMRGKGAMDPEWRFLEEDGSPLTVENYPVNRVIGSGGDFHGRVLGICRPDRAEPTWVLCSGYPVKDTEGNLIQAVITFSDVTELKQSKAELRASGESLAITLHSIGDAVIATDVVGLITRMNPTAERLTGWSMSDALGRPLTEIFRIINAQTRVPSVDPVQAVLAHGEVVELANHTVLLARDGQEYQIADSAAPIRDANKQIVGVVLVFSDVTEKYRLEESLFQATELLKNASEIAKVGGWELELAPMKLTWSLGTYHLHELDPGAPVDVANAIQFYAPEAQPVIASAVQAAIETGTPYDLELPLITAKGRAFWAQAKCNPVTENGRVVKLVGAFQDITERKQMEELLRKKERYQRALLDNFPFAVWLKDTESRFLSVNAGFVRVFGARDAEELVGKTDFDIAPRDMAEAYRADDRIVLDSKQKKNVEEAIWTDGVCRWFQTYKAPVVDDNGTLLGTVGFARDITEERQVEGERGRLLAQLQQSQKMESLGTLAGGVAHDMNNVLGAILGLASAHIGTQPYGSPLHQALDTICKATERGGRMVRSLLSFARQSPAESHKLDMNEILKEEVKLLERTTLAMVRLEMDLEANLRPILGDANALTHAFLNLCVNAVDAMPENGTLTLRTRNVDNGWIEVMVEDNGTGMSKEVLEKAMEPFFTTKETGKGTGLGLSMVFSTVKAHRGQMAIESEPGKGTRVMMRFPACEQETPALACASAVSGTTQVSREAMKVLLIDDDDLIQCSVQMLLKAMGHTAVSAALSGEEALAMLEGGLEADLVILDMNMPGLGGIGTLPRLRELRPEVPILLATGRVDQKALTLASAYPGVTLLSKPFGLRDLQEHLESIGLG